MRSICFLIVAAVIASTPALAAGIDFKQAITDPDGRPFTDCAKTSIDRSRCEEEVDLTLGRLCYSALNHTSTGLTPEQIVQRGAMSLVLSGAGVVDIDDKQIELLKTVLAEAAKSQNYKPIIVFRAYQMLGAK